MSKDKTNKKSGLRKGIIGAIALLAVVAIAVIGAIALKDRGTSVEAPTTKAPVVLTDESGTSATHASTTSIEVLPDGSTVIITEPPEQTTTSISQPTGITRSEGVYTFLLVGVDEGRSNTDVIMVASFDTVNNTLNVLNIPRDTYSNAAGTRSLKHINQAFRYGGIEQLKKEVLNMVGFEVDAYCMIDMSAFVKIINKLGGVYFDVPQDMNYDDPTQDLHIHLSKGYQLLNGTQSLQLCRYRSGYYNADIGRIQVRSNFLKAMASQVLSNFNISKAAELAGLIIDNSTTDISLADLTWYGKQMFELGSDKINFYTLPGGPAKDSGMWIPYKNELLTMINNYINPYSQDIVTINIVQRSENAGK